MCPEHWDSGHNPWWEESSLYSIECLVCFADLKAWGKILEVNGPFRHCHGKVDPSSFHKRCVSDLCLHGGLQPRLCHSQPAFPTGLQFTTGVPDSVLPTLLCNCFRVISSTALSLTSVHKESDMESLQMPVQGIEHFIQFTVYCCLYGDICSIYLYTL